MPRNLAPGVHAVCWGGGRKTRKKPLGQYVSTACSIGGPAGLLNLSTVQADVTCPECLTAIRDGGWGDGWCSCCDRAREEGHRPDCRFAQTFSLPRGRP